MAGKYKYSVEVKFSNETEGDDKFFFHDKIPYPRSNGNLDELIVSQNSIKIEAFRHKATNIKDIFSNHQSALYKQIVKSLIYYYCRIGESYSIEYIKVSLSREDNILNEFIVGDSINQIFNTLCDLTILKEINEQNLTTIFNESKIGYSLQFALTHFIKSFSNLHTTDSFEKKWKAFNALYKEVPVYDLKNPGKRLDNPNENNCHQALRKYMESNQADFPLITKAIDPLTVKEIRDHTRWCKMILNDYDENKAKAFKDFILRNKDCRLMQISHDTLNIRKSALTKAGLYDEVNDHINANLTEKDNIQLAATLCIKYAYFVRNKSIHAEKMDSGFRLLPMNKEEIESRWISNLLNLLIVDIINNLDKF
ncbi:TPA: hypothetical protein ACX6Q7_002062 [Photobacterium damselae]